MAVLSPVENASARRSKLAAYANVHLAHTDTSSIRRHPSFGCLPGLLVISRLGLFGNMDQMEHVVDIVGKPFPVG